MIELSAKRVAMSPEWYLVPAGALLDVFARLQQTPQRSIHLEGYVQSSLTQTLCIGKQITIAVCACLSRTLPAPELLWQLLAEAGRYHLVSSGAGAQTLNVRGAVLQNDNPVSLAPADKNEHRNERTSERANERTNERTARSRPRSSPR